ncbi:MAG: thioredoxin fold domain-containing protein [Aquificae bacterium]|nr:thioredoxin fold domain-containing protein [Aquificota bacterium]
MTVVRILLIFLVCLSFLRADSWFSDLDEAAARAREEGKVVLIYFYGKHCPYCHQVEEFLFSDPEVEILLRDNFTVVGVDTSERPDLVQEFSVFGVPSFVVYDPESGKVLATFFGSLPKEQFLSLLIKACNKSSVRRC